MVTTLMPSPAHVRFVRSRACTAFMPATPVVSTATPAVSASNPFAPVAMTRWLDGNGALGNGNHEGMYAIERIHPGRLGGVT